MIYCDDLPYLTLGLLLVVATLAGAMLGYLLCYYARYSHEQRCPHCDGYFLR